MEIKEGMYVRYVASFHHNDSDKPVVKIGKIIGLVGGYIQLDTFWPNNGVFPTEDFKKFIKGEPSFDIIDLIKPGDYVNGKEVVVAGYNSYDEICVSVKPTDGRYDWEYIYPKGIKTILTKEQYESMSYKLED